MVFRRNSLQKLWLKLLFAILVGYALMGKGFAYLFLGETLLLFGIVIFLMSGRLMLLLSDSVLFLWTLFALLGFARTLPFISTYHADAMRDAVVWGYGLFAVIIVAFIGKSEQISHTLNAYRKVLRWYIPIAPLLIVVSLWFKEYLFVLPWTVDVPPILVRPDEVAVHLAAATVFLLIFAEGYTRLRRGKFSLQRGLIILGGGISTLEIILVSRGGLLAIIVPLGVASIVKAKTIAWKIVGLTLVGAALGTVALLVNPFTISFKGNTMTPDQVLGVFASIGSGDDAKGHEGTKEFRLVWWHSIVDYTVFGPYFWNGKGFGVNLSTEAGAPNAGLSDSALRSPHNASMTILARMGVPGLALWIALNLVFASRLILSYKSAIRSKSLFWSRTNLWIFCYWLAALVNMSFDVYLEGPQGGILFWSVIGFGIAIMRVQAYEVRCSTVKLASAGNTFEATGSA